jgi:endonuclease-3
MRTSRVSRDATAALSARRARPSQPIDARTPERRQRVGKFRKAAYEAVTTGFVERSDSDPYLSDSDFSEFEGEESEFEVEVRRGFDEDEEDVEEREGRWTVVTEEEREELVAMGGSGGRKRKRDTGNVKSTPAKKRLGANKAKQEGDGTPDIKKENGTTTKPKPKKPRTTPVKKAPVAVKSEPPPNWEEIYSLVAAMRATRLAPVDTMGCESLASPTASPRDQRFQTLIALMLSSQTKDTVTSAAITSLQTSLPGGLALESILAVEPDTLNNLIGKVGFHNLKTKYIKNTALLLKSDFKGDIPDTIQGLTSLPGVGPKMAYLCMSAAWGRDEGIGVDVHVHRITNLWGWCKTNNPEETRKSLESWLPRERWHGINNLLVGFGQTVCLPVGRKCGECSLAERGLCRGAVVGKTAVKRVKKQVVVKGEDEGEVVVKEEVEVEAEEREIKAEEVDDLQVPDIEDLGKLTPGRSTRSRR